MRLTVIEAPESLFAWATVKAHCSIDDDSFKSQVMTFANAATAYAEKRMRISLMPRTIEATYYSGETLDLLNGPYIEIVSVRDDTNSDIAYETQYIGSKLRVITTIPYKAPLTVIYQAGYELDEYGADTVPADIKQVILCHTATCWMQRETISSLEMYDIPSMENFYRVNARGGWL